MKTSTKSIEYADLIGLPYKPGGSNERGADCVGVGRMALERMGAPLEGGDLPLDETDLWASLADLAASPSESPWILLGPETAAATRLGDIVLSQTKDGAHVAVLVCERRRIVLTACAPMWADHADTNAEPDQDGVYPLKSVLVREGQTYACAARRIHGCVGVYRLRRWGAGR